MKKATKLTVSKEEKPYFDAIQSAVNAVHGALAQLRFALAKAADAGIAKAHVRSWLHALGYSPSTVERRIQDAFGRVQKEHSHKGTFKKDTLATADELLQTVVRVSDGAGEHGEKTLAEVISELTDRIAAYTVKHTKDAAAAKKKAGEITGAIEKKIVAAINERLEKKAAKAKPAAK